MGNEAEFHFGKRRSREGLEFVTGRKRTSFNRRAPAAHRTPEHHAAHQTTHHTAPEAVAQAEIRPEPVYEVPEEAAIPATVPEALLQPDYPEEPIYTDDDPFAHIYQEPVLAVDGGVETAITETDATASAPTAEDEGIELYEERRKKHPKARLFFSYFTALIAVAIVGVSVFFLMNNKPAISSDIRSKVGFVVYEVAPNSTFVVDRTSVNIAKEGNLVFFVDNKETKGHFIISEQKIPDVVKSDADYQQFLAGFDKYAEFKSAIGTAYFTRPANIGSDVSVVVKTSSTLLFIRGPGATSEADWTQLLSYLRVAK